MKVIGLIGAITGTSPKAVMQQYQMDMATQYPEIDFEIIDLSDYNLAFSDGRNYLDYEGDTGMVLKKIMDADGLVISTPIYQASIPGVLKNVFDLLPEAAFYHKVLGVMAVGGSDKHFLVLEHQLKPVLNFMKAQIISSVVFVTKKQIVNGMIISSDVRTRISQLADELIDRIQACKMIQSSRDSKYDF